MPRHPKSSTTKPPIGRTSYGTRAHGAELEAKGLAALALVEGREEDRRRSRLGHGCADAHEHARADQRGDAAADGAQQRRGKEYGEADQVQTLPADDVREPPHGQEQGADCEGVGDHDPLDGGQVGAELVGDAGEGYRGTAPWSATDTNMPSEVAAYTHQR